MINDVLICATTNVINVLLRHLGCDFSWAQRVDKMWKQKAVSILSANLCTCLITHLHTHALFDFGKSLFFCQP